MLRWLFWWRSPKYFKNMTDKQRYKLLLHVALKKNYENMVLKQKLKDYRERTLTSVFDCMLDSIMTPLSSRPKKEADGIKTPL